MKTEQSDGNIVHKFENANQNKMVKDIVEIFKTVQIFIKNLNCLFFIKIGTKLNRKPTQERLIFIENKSYRRLIPSSSRYLFDLINLTYFSQLKMRI